MMVVDEFKKFNTKKKSVIVIHSRTKNKLVSQLLLYCWYFEALHLYLSTTPLR